MFLSPSPSLSFYPWEQLSMNGMKATKTKEEETDNTCGHPKKRPAAAGASITRRRTFRGPSCATNRRMMIGEKAMKEYVLVGIFFFSQIHDVDDKTDKFLALRRFRCQQLVSGETQENKPRKKNLLLLLLFLGVFGSFSKLPS